MEQVSKISVKAYKRTVSQLNLIKKKKKLWSKMKENTTKYIEFPLKFDTTDMFILFKPFKILYHTPEPNLCIFLKYKQILH